MSSRPARWSLALVLLAGCDAPEPLFDAGPTPVDTGPAPADAGPAPVDAGPIAADAGPLPSEEPTPLPLPAPDAATPAAISAWVASLGSPRAVCSGEANHGVAQSWDVHRWVLDALRERGPLTTVAFELNRVAVLDLQRFLESGDEAFLDDYRRTSSGLSAVDGLLHFVRHLRALREDGFVLRVTGIDVPVRPAPTVEALVAFVEAAAPGEASRWRTALGATDLEGVALAAEDFLAFLDDDEARLVAAVGADAVDAARVNARDLRDGARFFASFPVDGFEAANATYREPAMARNAVRLADSQPEGAPLLLIAHDLHCSAERVIGRDLQGEDSPAFGTVLRQRFGDRYRTLGQAYASGTFLLTPGVPSTYPTIEGSLEALLGAALLGDAALLSGRWRGVALDGSLPAAYANGGPVIAAREHDAYVFLRRVDAATVDGE